MGSPAAAAWIAQLAFWILLALGMAFDAVSKKSAAVLVALWLIGYFGLPRISWWTGSFVTSWVAILDIVLVLVVFGGDVRFT